MKHVMTVKLWVDDDSDLLRSKFEARGVALLDWVEGQLKHKDVQVEVIEYGASATGRDPK